jgi:hypothetical protein
MFTRKMHYFFLVLMLTLSQCAHAYKVGLLMVATGKYLQFALPLIESARVHFCADHEVTYFVFTDGEMTPAPDIVVLEHPLLGWPKDTMCRCMAYVRYADQLSKMDFLYALDADMLFIDTVGDEIFSDRVATHHAGYYRRVGTPETRKESRAYLDPNVRRPYFAGGFYGGASEEFLKMSLVMKEDIEADLANNIVPIWHDESVLNHYFAYHEPTCMLSPEYCMTDPLVKSLKNLSQEVMDMKGKLLALAKNHAAFRA